MGFLFQDYALFPHLTVEENVAFGLVEARWPREAREGRVRELLKRMELTPTPGSAPRSFPGASNRGWPWPGPWPLGPGSSSWTSP